jgi:L-asparaginase
MATTKRLKGTRERAVTVLSAGGTIASRPQHGGVVASDGPDAVVDGLDVPGVFVTAEEVLRVGSYAMDEADLRTVARAAVEAAAHDDIDGVVVTHGTDTMEETAFLADLAHRGDAPIVLTGAQRNAAEPDGDGPRNVRDAVRLAAHPAARDLGVVVAMGGRAWPARHAAKTHTVALDAFSAPSSGPVADLSGDDVRVLAHPPRTAGPGVAALRAPLPRVEVVGAYAGGDGGLLRAAVAQGARGIVIAAFGIGNVTPDIAAAVEETVAQGVPVLVVSRCGAGPAQPVYGGRGGGAELERAGALYGGTLRAAQARLALAVALATAPDGGVADLIARLA